jgi:hypothetical protein
MIDAPSDILCARLIHCHQLDEGGYVAAWEQPTLLVDEMRIGFKSPW